MNQNEEQFNQQSPRKPVTPGNQNTGDQNNDKAKKSPEVKKIVLKKKTAEEGSKTGKSKAIKGSSPEFQKSQEASSKSKLVAETVKPGSKKIKAAGEATIKKKSASAVSNNKDLPVKKTKVKNSVNEEKGSADVKNLRRISFQLRYHTKVGQNIFVTGNHLLLGNNDVDAALPLHYLNEDYWFGDLVIPEDQQLIEPIEYKYFVRDEHGIVDMEIGGDKTFEPGKYFTEEVRLIDSWNFAGHFENAFLTEPFKNILLTNEITPVAQEETHNFTHTFRIKAPLLRKNQVMNLYGSAAELGKWDVESPVRLSRKQGDDWWTVSLDLSSASYPITYKYGVVDIDTNEPVQLETGRNRVVYDGAGPDKVTILSDGFAMVPKQYFKGAGVAIPVFSLRSKNGLGVGEFEDLKGLVDWAKHIGLKVIQILPVNDTIATHTWVDSYPYAAISAFALHPIFLHIPSVVSQQNKELLQGLDAIKEELNALDKVDYERSVTAKLQFIKKIYLSQKEETFSREDFNEFFGENKHWLVPYAAFSYFRDEYGTPDFSKWPAYTQYNEAEIQELASSPANAKDEISIHFFTQFHLHLQLKSAKEYAHQNGIIVKGDIPIGIFRNSADAWQEPGLYNMDKQAGAPPDDFAVKGQNWGFPTYNWQRMQQDGFAWWKKRFAQMSNYFDAFRIDHILGFFRIWSIPMHAVEGIMGTFVPAVPVYKSELESHGIYADMSRFTMPYINEEILWQIFGELAFKVKQEYLHETGNGHYALKAEFDTQRKVHQYFEALPTGTENARIKNGLFDLVSNVILFEAEGTQGQQFHFRIAMDNTTSFRYLDAGTQHRLKELYINYFFRRQDQFWMEEAMQKLPELKRSTNMLICGEDLGMVPDCVPGVMKQLGILSLEIQRMPKDPTREFFHPNDAPYLSVVTPSTHDMSTIRGWWEEDQTKTQRFYNQQLGKWGKAPFFCEPEINTAIVVQHMYSPAMWSIFQLQDLLGMDGAIRRSNPNDERINVPANPKHYWQYRMHLSLEDLLNQDNFNSTLQKLIVDSGR